MTSSKHFAPNARTALMADAAAIVEMERAVFPDPYSLHTVNRLIGENYAFALVCEDETGALCGYLLAQCIPPEAELLRIAVLPSARRNGAARALMARFLSVCAARGASDLFLEVRASNDAAIALYRAYGFDACGTRRQYYKSPTEDALLMARHDESNRWSGNVCTACPPTTTENP